MYRRAVSVVLVALLSVCASAEFMTATDSLANLLGGGSLNLGDIVIDNFGAIETIDAGSGAVAPANPANIGVTATFDCETIEIVFGDGTGGLGGFVAGASEGGQYDVLLSFDISNVSGGITSASLSQLAGGAGPAFANITESITYTNGAGDPVGVGLTTDENFTVDTTDLIGTPSNISVTKDILLQSFEGSSAQISQFSQSFTTIPEPTAFGLVALGLMGVSSIVRRRRR